MRITNALIAAATVFGLSGTAHAQVGSGMDGTLSFAYISAPDDDWDYVLNGNGSGVFSISPSIRAQADFGIFQYENDDDTYFAANIHVIMNAGEGFDLGAGYSASSYSDGFEETGVFVEARYDTGQFALEGFVFQYLGDYSQYLDYGIEGSFALNDQFDVYVGYTAEVESGEQYLDNIYGGARFDIGNGFHLDARAASMAEGDYNYYTIAIVKHFGNGRVFAPRGYMNAFPGY